MFVEALSVVAVAWRGRLAGHDIADALRDIYADARWHDAYDTVWIYNELDMLDVSLEEVGEIYAIEVEQTSAASTGTDVAVVKRELDEMLAHFFIAMGARLEGVVRRKGMGRTLEEELALIGGDGGRAAILRAAIAATPWKPTVHRRAG